MDWRKSSYSFSQGNCVEVAQDGDTVPVRDSKDPAGPQHAWTREEWDVFVEHLKSRLTPENAFWPQGAHGGRRIHGLFTE